MNFDGAPAAVLGREAMRELDARTIAAGTPSHELMERAGAALAAFLQNPDVTGIRLPDRTAEGPPRLLVLAGRGNNGGDGYVVARLLAAEGWRTTVALVSGEPSLGTDAATNLEEWRRLGGAVALRDRVDALLHGGPDGFDLCLDAIYGTGLVRPVQGAELDLIHRLNESGLPTVSVDIPSGLCSDTGRPLGGAVHARATLTIGAAKPGLFLAEGPQCAGRVQVADIGLLDPARVHIEAGGVVLDDATTAGSWPRLSPHSHKGTRGHVVIVAGSRGKTGAAVLAARGALRAGAGLVTVASVPEVQSAVSLVLPEAMTDVVAADAHGQIDAAGRDALASALAKADAIVIGPGLGTGAGADAAVELALGHAVPVLLDADALNGIAKWDAARRQQVFGHRAGLRAPAAVLTPHPGEMGRLVGRTAAEVQLDRQNLVATLAETLGVVVALKGAATLVSDGRRCAFNLSGNAGMATGGMGDVLAGIGGALLARGRAASADPFEAACLSVYVHGAAGDRLLADTGTGFLASELADRVPLVLASRMPR